MADLPQPSSEIIDDAVQRLEGRWRSHNRVDLAEFVPPATDPSRQRVLVELIKVDQEYRFESGQPKRLESYLSEWPELGAQPETIRELLEAECYTRTALGEPVTAEELESRFPAQSRAIDLAQIASQLGKVDSVRGQSDVQLAAEGHQVGNPTPDNAATRETVASDNVSTRNDKPLPNHVGRYSVQRCLGEGAFGIIYLARDEDLHRQVAIKVPRCDRIASEDSVEKFLEEARAAAQLREQPGIVSVYDCGRQDDGVPYVVMDYIEGPSLKGLLQRERLSHDRIATYAAHIARAIHAAHKQGLVHRDLKPDNILIDADGLPRVTDFGLALHESVQRLRSGELAGTIPYMSPEQIRGKSQHLDGRTDIWAVGVMLYQMLTERLPFGGESLEQLSDEIQNREPKPPRQIDDFIPAELERICLKCLAKPITDRYTSAADLAAELERWRTSDTTQQAAALCTLPAASGVTTVANPPTVRRKWPVIGGSVLAIALLIAAAAWLIGQLMVGPLTGSVDVLVWDPNDANRTNLPLHDERARPLRPGDQIRIKADFSRPTYAYLVWIDGQGVASPVYPWLHGQWNERPKEESPVESLHLPPAGDQAWEMIGAKGMETLLLLARATPLPDNIKAKALFTGLPVMPMHTPESILWFHNGQPITWQRDRTRAPILYETLPLNDPLLRAQAVLQERLKEYFLLNEAVSFANAGQEP